MNQVIEVNFKGHIEACSSRRLKDGTSYTVALVDLETLAALKKAGLVNYDEETKLDKIDSKFKNKSGEPFVCFAGRDKTRKVSVLDEEPIIAEVPK